MRKILLFLIVIMVTLTVGAQKILEGTKPSLKGVNKIRLKIDFSETKIDNKTVADWLEYRQASQPKYNAKNELENELKPVVQEKVIKSLNNKLSKKGAFVTLNSNAKYTLLVKPVSVSMKGDNTNDCYILDEFGNILVKFHISGSGGHWGTMSNLWGDGYEDSAKSIASFVVKCKKLLMTKKKLPVRFTGQHFTIDKVLIKDAIRQANISNQDTVLDIGAGKGFLTVHLLKIANNVVAIENDTALVEHLRKLFSDARNVQVVGCDFRNFAVPKFPFKVVSNIPYGITSDIFKILMFESLGNFLGGSIVLQLEPTQKLFSRKLYNPYTVFYHTFFDLKLVYEVGPESFFPPPTVKSALLNIKRKQLFFDFKFKAKYLAFISCLLEKPDLSVKTALKSIFRKSQVRSISEKFGLNLNAQIVCLSPSQWVNCFLEMLEVVPEKFHPS